MSRIRRGTDRTINGRPLSLGDKLELHDKDDDLISESRISSPSSYYSRGSSSGSTSNSGSTPSSDSESGSSSCSESGSKSSSSSDTVYDSSSSSDSEDGSNNEGAPKESEWKMVNHVATGSIVGASILAKSTLSSDSDVSEDDASTDAIAQRINARWEEIYAELGLVPLKLSDSESSDSE